MARWFTAWRRVAHGVAWLPHPGLSWPAGATCTVPTGDADAEANADTDPVADADTDDADSDMDTELDGEAGADALTDDCADHPGGPNIGGDGDDDAVVAAADAEDAVHADKRRDAAGAFVLVGGLFRSSVPLLAAAGGVAAWVVGCGNTGGPSSSNSDITAAAHTARLTAADICVQFGFVHRGKFIARNGHWWGTSDGGMQLALPTRQCGSSVKPKVIHHTSLQGRTTAASV